MIAVQHCLQGTLIESGKSRDVIGMPWGDAEREEVQMALREKVIENIDSGNELE